MTRLFTDGAESGDLLRWTSVGSYTSVVSSGQRTGSKAYRVAGAVSNAFNWKAPSAVTEFYMRWAVKSSQLNAAEVLRWLNSASAEIGRINLVTTAPFVLTIRDNTVRGTSPALAWLANEYHVLELHVKLGGVGVGRFEIKFDGTLVVDYTGITNALGSDIQWFCFGSICPNGGPTNILDDMAINDTAGAADNSWCGDGGVLAALVPITGAAEYTDLIASTGDPWECVNEIPANADYVYESTVNKKSTYLLSDLAGLPSGASIARVWVELDALETAADGDKIATLLRSATTDAQGTDQALTLAYARYLSAEYLVDPAGGEDPTWTEAKLNALQAGCVIR